MKSKLRKFLGDEVNVKYRKFLNGELKKTHDEVDAYAAQFDECDLDCIRLERLRLHSKINDLTSGLI